MIYTLRLLGPVSTTGKVTLQARATFGCPFGTSGFGAEHRIPVVRVASEMSRSIISLLLSSQAEEGLVAQPSRENTPTFGGEMHEKIS